MFNGLHWYYLKYDMYDSTTEFLITTTQANTTVYLPSLKMTFHEVFKQSQIRLNDSYRNFGKLISKKPAYVVSVTGPSQTLTSIMPIRAWTNVYFIITPNIHDVVFEYRIIIHSKYLEFIRIDGKTVTTWLVKHEVSDGMAYGISNLVEKNTSYVTEQHKFGCYVYGSSRETETKLHYIQNARSTPDIFK
ncbi:uncharacterized protein LOC131932045, partial [Physella acuta]|uniref:uncharacterized protein LOC131932045 n=1 Tax=Physella acuta TaxID=109671 RepID=UPI0027DDA825